MADSVSTEAWLDQRRWAALEEALKAQGSNVKRHLQDYLITLYNETVPLERWVQIETAITKHRQRKTRKSMWLFIFGRMAMTVSSQRVMARNFWMWPYGCAVICKETPRR